MHSSIFIINADHEGNSTYTVRLINSHQGQRNMQNRKRVFGISTKHVPYIRMYKRNIRLVKSDRIRQGGKPGQWPS